MKQLINDQGQAAFGVFDAPVDEINYRDYAFFTPMGWRVPKFFNRFKCNQFVFAGITGPDVIIGLAVVDLKYLANGFFYIFDRGRGTIAETSKTLLPLGGNIFIDPTPESLSCGFTSDGLVIAMKADRITARAKNLELGITLNLAAVSPLRICTRAGYNGWTFTRKTTPIPLTGTAACNDRRFDLASPSHMALLDWTAGFMRRETFWNWAAAAATLPDGRSFGMNFSCGVNETGFTENGFWIDGQLTKISTVHFEFDPLHFYTPWRVLSADGKVNLTFTPEKHREEHQNAGIAATRFHQMMGRFNGNLTTDAGDVVYLFEVPGWTEDHYAKW